MKHYVIRWACSTGVRIVEGVLDDGYFRNVRRTVFVSAKEAFPVGGGEVLAKEAVLSLIDRNLAALGRKAKKLEALRSKVVEEGITAALAKGTEAPF